MGYWLRAVRGTDFYSKYTRVLAFIANVATDLHPRVREAYVYMQIYQGTDDFYSKYTRVLSFENVSVNVLEY